MYFLEGHQVGLMSRFISMDWRGTRHSAGHGGVYIDFVIL